MIHMAYAFINIIHIQTMSLIIYLLLIKLAGYYNLLMSTKRHSTNRNKQTGIPITSLQHKIGTKHWIWYDMTEAKDRDRD